MKFTTNDIAKMMGVTSSAITNAIRRGEIEAETVMRPVSEGGGQYVIPKKEAQRFLAKKMEEYREKVFTYRYRVSTIEGSLDMLSNTEN